VTQASLQATTSPASASPTSAPRRSGTPSFASAAPAYLLGRSEGETRRLILQHQIYSPITRRVFEAAGIGAGMRVLDIGSGAGDVSILLAELVGPRGQVVGVDLNAAILETARARVQAAGWRNVTFYAGDARDLALGAPFDAVAGRWVLMHLTDPVAMLRFLATLLRPGGIVAFHESDFSYPPTMFPPSPLSRQILGWTCPQPGKLQGGPDMQMGTKLYHAFLDAGLPAPELRLEAPIGSGAEWPGYAYTAETVRSLLPMLERMLGVDPDDVGIDTLAERLREDAVAGGRVQLLPLTVGAWTRVAA
jgi:ubiquinone/menaquinone biosynthesis C-methylase UbiE